MDSILSKLESSYKNKNIQHTIIRYTIYYLHKKLNTDFILDESLRSCWAELEKLPFGNHNIIRIALDTIKLCVNNNQNLTNDGFQHIVLYSLLLICEQFALQILSSFDECKLFCFL